MKRYWELARSKVDALSLRERAIMFLLTGFLVYTLINTLLVNPLLAKKTALSAELVQQQEKIKELEAQVQVMMQEQLRVKREAEDSPLPARLAELKLKLQEQEGSLQSRSDQLIEPDKMAELLKQVLGQNDKLQLVELKTLPASSLVKQSQVSKTQSSAAGSVVVQKQIFRHGIQITVRGGYLDMLNYLASLEKMPSQMYWGEISFKVGKHPEAELTLTMYTLSLDETWLTV